MIHCFHLFWSTFSSLTGLVDKYSEKPKKLLVFGAFSEYSSIGKNDECPICRIRFFFIFALQ